MSLKGEGCDAKQTPGYEKAAAGREKIEDGKKGKK